MDSYIITPGLLTLSSGKESLYQKRPTNFYESTSIDKRIQKSNYLFLYVDNYIEKYRLAANLQSFSSAELIRCERKIKIILLLKQSGVTLDLPDLLLTDGNSDESCAIDELATDIHSDLVQCALPTCSNMNVVCYVSDYNCCHSVFCFFKCSELPMK